MSENDPEQEGIQEDEEFWNDDVTTDEEEEIPDDE